MNYQKIYTKLIEKAKIRGTPAARYDSHHIVPICLGGGNEETNIVKITPEEHYLAHQLLVKMHPRNGKLIWAALAMTGTGNGTGNGRKGNKLYGWLRRAFVANQTGVKRSKEVGINISKALKGKLAGTKHPLYGIPVPQERREKIRAGNIGKALGRKNGPMSEGSKNKLSISRKKFYANGGRTTKGYKHSPKAIAKMNKYWSERRAAGIPGHPNSPEAKTKAKITRLTNKKTRLAVLSEQLHHHKPFPAQKQAA
jgi:hypothetical protein